MASKVPLTEEEKQRKVLEDAKNVIKVESFYMKRALDAGKLMDAIKHASNFISELRTSLLSPKDYYSLYIVAFDELRFLESYLYGERDKHGKKMSELYELVQYAGNVLPRLYLLVTVASAYIKTKEAPTKDILRDVVEMCKGIQNPTRGLFLRNYLSEMTKDKLPDVGTESMIDGDVKDSVEFVLNNFVEMNKLWVRLHMGPAREREKREGERQELRILVGKNLSRLGQLEGVDVELYQKTILPRILEQVISCKDKLAQQYLMEIVVQVFPDEFHLSTLDQLLGACSRLVARVDIKAIVASLIDRLARFIAGSPSSAPNPQALFATFERSIELLACEPPKPTAPSVDQPNDGKPALTPAEEKETPRVKLQCHEYLALQVSLTALCLKCFPTVPQLVDELMGNVDTYLGKLEDPESAKSSSSVQQLMQLLALPVDTYNDGLRVLAQLPNYTKVTARLGYERRKQAQLTLLRNLVAHETSLTTADQVTSILTFASALVRDEQDQPDAAEIDRDDFEEEQHLIASMIHVFRHESPEQLFAMYFVARRFFGVGGKDRIRHTLPALIFAVLRLAQGCRANFTKADDAAAKKFGTSVFMFVNETVKALRTQGYSEQALRLNLQAALVACQCGFDNNATEFVGESLTIYEEEITGGVEQFAALTLVTDTLYALTINQSNAEAVEAFDALTTAVAKHSLKLLKKPDQCRALCQSSHLFWRSSAPSAGDSKRVLECLQKSLKTAGSGMSAGVNVQLFVEILNFYLYYFELKNPAVNVKYISGLISLINTDIAQLDPAAAESASITAFYKNTLAFIQSKKNSDNPGAYAEIDVDSK